MRHLYIQRPGHAEPCPLRGERQLTQAGATHLQAAAAGLARAGLVLGAIAHSPLARTRQTAQAMASLLAPGGALIACPALAPEGEAPMLVDWLASHLDGAEPRLLIGHMPQVAQWSALWANAPAIASHGFAPGTMARLDVAGELAAGAADLGWLASVESLAQAPPPAP